MVDVRRVRNLNSKPISSSGPVVYVMAREQRVSDNWALLYAQEQALARQVPILVLFIVGPMFNHGTKRHNDWMIGSLKDVTSGLSTMSVPFFVECGLWSKTLADFVLTHQVGEVVFDFNPLEPVRSWRLEAAKKLSVLVTEVDARNIVPCWVASPKAEYAAYTFRPKIHRKLTEFLTKIPKTSKHPYHYAGLVPIIDWDRVSSYRQVDTSIKAATRFVPGEQAGRVMAIDFISNRLCGYSSKRNDPTEDGVSNLSPYLRWGNISAQWLAQLVSKTDAPKDDKDAFLEELIVRRELSDNYCFYTPDYDKVTGAHAWAEKTIREHANDVREYLYTYEQFAAASTHDSLWNAAQNQMMVEGKMHGFMRMYWAKKILEWTPDAQAAIDIALRLNDTYELDGRDSNGVAGVMWSICGLHDRAWNERPVFGKIRYMNYAGCKRKFDVKSYIEKYSSDKSEALF